jgi:hypothetical protein
MVFWLVVLLAVVAIAVFVWNYRRQAAAREAASAERMKAFLDAARSNAPASDAASDAPAENNKATINRTAAGTAAARATPVAAATVSGYVPRTPLLTAEQRALHGLLKNSLPDHQVFACVSLAAFIQPADTVTGFAREAQQRRLADAVADFVVCDASLKAIAAVQCGARSGKAAESAAFAAACAASTGVRWVEISPQVLPDAADIRQRVLGA